MAAALSNIAIAARAALDHCASPMHHGLLLTMMAEIEAAAKTAAAQNEEMAAADQAAFEQHLAGTDQAHECGTPAPGTLDTSDYPARLIVLQRDPADPESWIFRCGERHASNGAAGIGWQSPDYASEDDALIAAGDHARAMHDMGLPNALAERVAAAEQAAAESRPWVKTCSHDGCVMTGRHTHGTMSVA